MAKQKYTVQTTVDACLGQWGDFLQDVHGCRDWMSLV